MNKRTIFIYAWDLLDEGIEAALSKLKKMGVNGIAVTAAYHSGKFLLPHNPNRKIYYHTHSSVYYNVNTAKYGQLLPRTGDAFEQYRIASQRTGTPGDLLTSICHHAKALQMQVYAWVVGFHNSYLGEAFPEFTVRNAFGESYRHALCPAHKETQQYVTAILSDLAEGYDLDGFVLESFDFPGMLHGDHHELVGSSRKDELERLLGLCFCDQCMANAQSAGIDAAQFRREIAQAAETVANSRKPVTAMSLPSYKQFIQMREETVAGVFAQCRSVMEGSGKPLQLLSTLWMAYGSDPGLYGMNPHRLDRYVDQWIACYPSSAHDTIPFVDRALQSVPRHKLAAGVRLIEPEIVTPEQLDGYLNAYSKAGIDDLFFYNYGLASGEIVERLGISLE
ncbi:hypothetical protein [Paenibacillus sp. J2TS4]|uniref:hypothetical protein n=1 Tax=Paenibacillus sp. J2TS4 TaxID=2807194 RepID=UPI001B20A653|nr:hypothetical protein [Paenibacillus sp. J2TS4]GIP31734.1 hypothetical protein J2TS4_09440 [Paenibacillus sp. J2TS4]